jgi:hypothetical protein
MVFDACRSRQRSRIRQHDGASLNSLSNHGEVGMNRWKLGRTAPLVLVGTIGMFTRCQAQPLPTAAEADAFASKVTPPASRPFYMGFTPWPYDFDEKAIEYTNRTVKQHGDLILFHLDNGVPWPEALSGAPFPEQMQSEIDDMKSQAGGFKKVYVSASPLSHNRIDLALYWSSDTHRPLPGRWDDKAIDDPEVILAYKQYCKRLIEFFNPDYFAYGIEINGGLNRRHKNWPRLLNLVSNVYDYLKKEFPRKTIFLTLQTVAFETSWDEQWEMSKDLVRYSDIVGMSTYPLWVPGKFDPSDANVDYIPATWFSQMRTLAPDKPWAITETGYIAENLDLRAARKKMRGSELWQARYVDLLLRQAHALAAEFVVWFVVRDYDRGMTTLERVAGAAAVAPMWKDMGLIDGEGRERAALRVWDKWFRVPVGR